MKSLHVIDEGIENMYVYHIRLKDKNYPGYFKAICGVNLLGKELPLDFWGLKTHMNEKYCEECMKIFKREELQTG